MDTKASRRLVIVTMLGLAVAGLFPALRAVAAEQRPEPRQHTVTIDATTYSPRTLTVHVGDTIVWVNKDLFPHTVTAKTGAFDSGDIATGKSWTYTVKAEGLFGYFCTYHPTMKGTLRIR
jgi:plastocyanin